MTFYLCSCCVVVVVVYNNIIYFVFCSFSRRLFQLQFFTDKIHRIFDIFRQCHGHNLQRLSLRTCMVSSQYISELKVGGVLAPWCTANIHMTEPWTVTEPSVAKRLYC